MKLYLKYILLMMSVIVYTTSFAKGMLDENKPINNTDELKIWCRDKLSEYFLAKNITPYNWTASWWDKGDFLFVEGSWRIDAEDRYVKCYVRRGEARKYASWEFIKESER